MPFAAEALQRECTVAKHLYVFLARFCTSARPHGAFDQKGVSAAVAERRPEAAIIVPPRPTAVPSEAAETAPTQRDRHLQSIAEHGRAAWQKASGHTKRARAETAVGRFKQVIGDPRSNVTVRRRAAARPPRAVPIRSATPAGPRSRLASSIRKRLRRSSRS